MKHLVVGTVCAVAAGAFVLTPTPAGVDTIRMDAASYDIPALPSREPTSLPTASATATPAERTTVRLVDPTDIPTDALVAYQRAAQILGEVSPSCDLPWTLLAAIGAVESDHGRHPGSSSETGATPQAPVRVSTARQEEPISADGPMQIAPALWKVVGVDGDGDGSRSVRDIDDAALAAGVYLCAGWEGLDDPEEMSTALSGYRESEDFVALVVAYERAYRSADFEDTTKLEATAHSGTPNLSGAPEPGVGVRAGAGDKDHRDVERAVKQSKKAVKADGGTRSATRARDRAMTSRTDQPGGARGTKAGSTPTGKQTGSASPSAGGSKSPSKSPTSSPLGTPKASPTDTPQASPGGTPKETEVPSKTGSPKPSPTPSCPQESPSPSAGTPGTESPTAETSGPASNPVDASSSGTTGSPTASGTPDPSASPTADASREPDSDPTTPEASPSPCSTASP